MAPLTDVEAESCAILAFAGTGIMVQNGACLVIKNHQYLTGTAAAKRIAAILKQVLSTASAPAAAMVMSMLDNAEVSTLIYHAAGHPVREAVFMGLALDAAVPKRLEIAGLGSAAVGLPVKPLGVVRASAYVAVWRAFQATLEKVGAYVEVEQLVKHLAEFRHPETTPERKDEINEIVLPGPAETELLVPGIAYVAGYGTAAVENMTAADRAKVTQLTAYSVTNAARSSAESFLAGGELYRLNRAYDQGEAAAGAMDVRTMFISGSLGPRFRFVSLVLLLSITHDACSVGGGFDSVRIPGRDVGFRVS